MRWWAPCSHGLSRFLSRSAWDRAVIPAAERGSFSTTIPVQLAARPTEVCRCESSALGPVRRAGDRNSGVRSGRAVPAYPLAVGPRGARANGVFRRAVSRLRAGRLVALRAARLRRGERRGAERERGDDRLPDGVAPRAVPLPRQHLRHSADFRVLPRPGDVPPARLVLGDPGCPRLAVRHDRGGRGRRSTLSLGHLHLWRGVDRLGDQDAVHFGGDVRPGS